MMWDKMIRLHSLLLENRNASMRNTGGWQLNTTASDISLGFPVTRSSEIRTETIPVMNYRNGLNLGHMWYIHATSWRVRFLSHVKNLLYIKAIFEKSWSQKKLLLKVSSLVLLMHQMLCFLVLSLSSSHWCILAVCCVIILSRSGHEDVIQGWKLFIWGWRSFTVAL